jgi:predicted nucleotidyltransferase
MLLKNRDKQILKDTLQSNITQGIDALVYGSRTNGRAHSGSDLDLVLKTKNNKPLDITEFMNFKESLRQSNIPFLVDVLDWNRIPEYFQENIKKNYEILK